MERQRKMNFKGLVKDSAIRFANGPKTPEAGPGLRVFLKNSRWLARWMPHLCYAAVAVGFVFQIGYLAESADRLERANAIPRLPFEFKAWNLDSKIQSVHPEGIEGGVRTGDRLLSLQGSLVTSETAFRRALKAAHPGTTIDCRLQRPGGEEFTAIIRLQPEDVSAHRWVEVFLLRGGLPLFTILLAFYAIRGKPGDPRSWIVVGLLLSFAQLTGGGIHDLRAVFSWPGYLRYPGIAWGIIWWSLWPVWVILFALRFPDRSVLDRRLPWLKWVLASALFTLCMGTSLIYLATAENWDSWPALREVLMTAKSLRARSMNWTMLFAAILLALRGLQSHASDMKRRVRLLAIGWILALGPQLILERLASGMGIAPLSLPVWLWMPGSFALAILPLTVAHVLVVERALDVQTAVRQLIQFAFGKGLVAAAIGVGTTFAVITVSNWASQREYGIFAQLAIVALGCLTFFAARQSGADLATWIDIRFFSSQRSPEEAISKIPEKLWRVTDPVELAGKSLGDIASALQARRASVFLLGDSSFELVRRCSLSGEDEESESTVVFARDSAFTAVLSKGASLVWVRSSSQRSWILALPNNEQRLLRELEAEFVIPFFHRSKLLAFVTIGASPSDLPFTPTGIVAIENMAAAVGGMLENCLLVRSLKTEIERRSRIESERQSEIETSKAKNQFLASMSHELRTPLNAIIGYGELLLEEASDDENLADAVPDVKRIVSSGHYLLELINSLLDFSKLEAGKLEIQNSTFELRNLLEDVLVIVNPLAAKNQNRFQLNAPHDLGSCETDRVKLRQILLNLIGNACKFTKQGTVAMTIARITGPAIDSLEFRISDSGIGMNEQQLSRLFKPFQQADSTISSRFGGTGLGLALSRSLAQLMGGDITVESTLHVGSTFILVLPATPPCVESQGVEEIHSGSPSLVAAGEVPL